MRTVLGTTLVLTTIMVATSAQAQEASGKVRQVANVDNNTIDTSGTVDTQVTTTTPAAGDTVVLESRRHPEIPAPRKAFEVGVEGGYTQPFGGFGNGRTFHDTADAGGAVGLSLGYRADPHWGVALTGQFQDNAGDSNLGVHTDVRGFSAGVKGTYHFRPFRLVDPYVSLGAGYRAMWLAPDGAPNQFFHGFQVARALVGVDFRVSKDVAIGPVIGADMNVFVWQNPGDVRGGSEQVNDPRPSTFLFGGLGATFDVGGTRVVEHPVLAKVGEIQAAAGPAAPREVRPHVQLESTGIYVDENIMNACGIGRPKAFFAFDSAEVKNRDVSTLQAVAICFTTGPLAGQSLRIVGHADPRGSDDYNMQLGYSRADSVEQYLSGQGLSATKVETESMGKRDATGVDENGWKYDRRVDLRLVK